MKQQLTLIESKRTWKLSEETRATGRRGLAEARRALESARPYLNEERRAA